MQWIIDEIKTAENKSGKANYEDLFYDISKKLMNNYQLKADNDFFNFAEIEFYYYNKDKHPDCNAHKHKLQKKSSIYFHDKHGRGGIDIGFGDNSCWGGILIRGLERSGIYTNGPLKVADKLSEILKKEYRELAEQGNLITSKKIVMIKKEEKDDKVFLAPRIGLSKDNDYLVSNYRFVINFNIPEHKCLEKSLIYLSSTVKNKKLTENIDGYKIETIMKDLKNKGTRAARIYDRYKPFVQ